ncbi:hypothetical protein B0T16DRAFT_221968 [Cercophora newfieldiana]|uniref:Uncharacterized protein n=1 Tax=Cercophora newfieldiana TaxID=92897 RepID=A0AA40CM01_9PEZI|nr:hypothetical protein B0T16DRAFT_221968 [Cercophora newfieldiana]
MTYRRYRRGRKKAPATAGDSVGESFASSSNTIPPLFDPLASRRLACLSLPSISHTSINLNAGPSSRQPQQLTFRFQKPQKITSAPPGLPTPSTPRRRCPQARPEYSNASDSISLSADSDNMQVAPTTASDMLHYFNAVIEKIDRRADDRVEAEMRRVNSRMEAEMRRADERIESERAAYLREVTHQANSQFELSIMMMKAFTSFVVCIIVIAGFGYLLSR